jgi:hypothetical protein
MACAWKVSSGVGDAQLDAFGFLLKTPPRKARPTGGSEKTIEAMPYRRQLMFLLQRNISLPLQFDKFAH